MRKNFKKSTAISEKIQNLESLIIFLDQKINILKIPSDDISRVAGSCFDVAHEHQKAILFLIEKNLIGSAFSIVRPLFEAYIRGVWLKRCTTDEDFKKYINDNLHKRVATMIEEIEKIPGFQDGRLSEIKRSIWNPSNSYVHTGYFPVSRRIENGFIGHNYEEQEIIEILSFSYIIGILAALEIALMANDFEFVEQLRLKI